MVIGTSWDFFNIKFTLGNLISRPKSYVLDRGMAEFIFPNATFITDEDYETCFCCKLNLPHNLRLGNIERLESKSYTNFIPGHLPQLDTIDDDETLINTHEDKFTFLSCGESYKEPTDFVALLKPFSKTTYGL